MSNPILNPIPNPLSNPTKIRPSVQLGVWPVEEFEGCPSILDQAGIFGSQATGI